MNPVISVVTSYYNDEKFLAESISSVLNQTYSDFEYILINHASEDRSREIAHSFADPRIKHVDLPINCGATGSILVESGLTVASANSAYVKLLSADDLLLPNALKDLLSVAQTQGMLDLVFGDVIFIEETKKPLGWTWFSRRFPPNLSEGVYLKHLLEGTSVFPFAGSLVKTSVLKQVLMDCTTIAVTDMIFWADILLRGGKLGFVSDPVALYRMHDRQMCGVAVSDEIERRMDFESMRLIWHILQAPWSLKRVNEVVDESLSLLPGEEDLIPYAISCHILAHTKNPAYIFCVRHVLADLLTNKKVRSHLQERFGWGIKELRNEILHNPVYFYQSKKDIAKKMSFADLTYCWIRKLAFGLLLRDWRHKRAKQSKRVL